MKTTNLATSVPNRYLWLDNFRLRAETLEPSERKQMAARLRSPGQHVLPRLERLMAAEVLDPLEDTDLDLPALDPNPVWRGADGNWYHD